MPYPSSLPPASLSSTMLDESLLALQASGTTINDVLVAALHLTAQSWNTKHGAPADRIGVQMPINIRPADRLWDVVSNLTSMVSVSTEPDDRADLATATAAVAEQTYEMRRNNRSYGLYDLLRATKKAPLEVKRAVPRLIHLTGDRFVDTAILSNLAAFLSRQRSLPRGHRSCGSPHRVTRPAESLSASPPAESGSAWSPAIVTNIRRRCGGRIHRSADSAIRSPVQLLIG